MNVLRKVSNWLQTASPVVLLAAFFSLIAVTLTAIAYSLPEELFTGGAAFVTVYLVIVLSRMTQLWQFGAEAHHFFTVCFALVFGPLPAIALVLATSITNSYIAMHVNHPFLVHTLPGPLQQSVDLFVIATLAGFLGQVAPDFALDNLVLLGTVFAAFGVAIEKTLCHMLCGVDIGRLSVAWTVNVLVEYNLFRLFGMQAILGLRAI